MANLRWVGVVCVPLLSGCEMLSAAREIAADPEVQKAVSEIAGDAIGGNWIGAAIGAGSLLSLLAGYKGFKWTAGRLTKSEPGAVI